jgi:hypothetical protein
MANESFACIWIDLLQKGAGSRLTAGCVIRCGRPPGCGIKADYALFSRQGCATGGSEAKSSSANLAVAEPWRLHANGQLCRAEQRM